MTERDSGKSNKKWSDIEYCINEITRLRAEIERLRKVEQKLKELHDKFKKHDSIIGNWLVMDKDDFIHWMLNECWQTIKQALAEREGK